MRLRVILNVARIAFDFGLLHGCQLRICVPSLCMLFFLRVPCIFLSLSLIHWMRTFFFFPFSSWVLDVPSSWILFISFWYRRFDSRRGWIQGTRSAESGNLGFRLSPQGEIDSSSFGLNEGFIVSKIYGETVPWGEVILLHWLSLRIFFFFNLFTPLPCRVVGDQCNFRIRNMNIVCIFSLSLSSLALFRMTDQSQNGVFSFFVKFENAWQY